MFGQIVKIHIPQATSSIPPNIVKGKLLTIINGGKDNYSQDCFSYIIETDSEIVAVPCRSFNNDVKVELIKST